jgi:hypothetical protein
MNSPGSLNKFPSRLREGPGVGQSEGGKHTHPQSLPQTGGE